MTPARKSWRISIRKRVKRHERGQEGKAPSPRRAGWPGACLHAQAHGRRPADGQRGRQGHRTLGWRHRQLSLPPREGRESPAGQQTPTPLRPQETPSERRHDGCGFSRAEAQATGRYEVSGWVTSLPASALEKSQRHGDGRLVNCDGAAPEGHTESYKRPRHEFVHSDQRDPRVIWPDHPWTIR